MFFEQAREHAEQEYGKNKRDTQVRRERVGGGERGAGIGPLGSRVVLTGPPPTPLARMLSPCVLGPWRCVGGEKGRQPNIQQPNITPPSTPPPPPLLSQALTRWGGALLELAHFCQGSEAYEKIQLVRERKMCCFVFFLIV